jgi:hypothetical protein
MGLEQIAACRMKEPTDILPLVSEVLGICMERYGLGGVEFEARGIHRFRTMNASHYHQHENPAMGSRRLGGAQE